MIRAELKLREQREELDYARSALLLRLTALYKVNIFEVKPQSIPQSLLNTGEENKLVQPEKVSNEAPDDAIEGLAGRYSYTVEEPIPESHHH